MAQDIVVGIDLGTTNSEVAAWHNGRVQVLEEGGSALFPSMVGIAPDGKLLVGEQARNQYVLYPARTVKSVKRLMGTSEPILLDGKPFSPQELSAMILRALKERAERVLGVAVTKAVITVPAYFSDAQRQATRDAGRIAGLDVVRMIHEPTAAVLAYESSAGVPAGDGAATPSKSQTVMIYDLGGGTLDVSIVQVQGDVTEVLASHGDTRLGGDDFDQLVYENILAFMREKLGVAASSPLDDCALKNRLLRAAEEAKKRLSFEERVVVREEYVGSKSGVPVHLEMELNRGQFEALVQPLLERSLQSVERALEGAGKQPADIDSVLLVGGSTRIPLVSSLLEKVMGKTPRKDIHPDVCVAHGAGVLAARVMGRDVEKVLVDVTPYTFGTSAIGDVGGFPSLDMFVPIIRRNSALPCSHSEDFFTAADRQEQVDVKVYQGEAEDARRNILVGRFLISGLSNVPAGNPIRMRMVLDVNGILHVTARETRTGLEKTVTIEGALSAMNDLQLEASRRRVDETAGDPFQGEDVADGDDDGVEFEGGEESSVIRAPDDAVSALPDTRANALPNTRLVQARALIEKAQRLLPKMHADDRDEAAQLIKAVEEALAAQSSERLDACSNELGEMLFFVEESA